MNTWPLQKDCPAFYGDPGNSPAQWAAWESANLVLVPCPWPLNMDGTLIKNIRIHKKCSDSLTRVLGTIWTAVGQDVSAIETLHYNLYSGSYNPRPMRGGSSRSMHGFGAEIDWDSEDNLQHATNHLFQDDSLLIVKFKEEGWVCGLDWGGSSIDSMHVQAARVHP